MNLRERKLLTETHKSVQYIVNDISVNGDGGEPKVKGLQNILREQHNRQAKQGKAIEELIALTETERTRTELRDSFYRYLKARPKLAKVHAFFMSQTFVRLLLTAIAGALGYKVLA